MKIEELQRLQEKGLWLVMHPTKSLSWENDQVFPWLGAEMTRTSQRISYYLRPCNHKFVVLNADHIVINSFHNYNSMNTLAELHRYCAQNNITQIIYTGFHYGECILSEKEVGIQSLNTYNRNPNRVGPRYKMFVRRELVDVGPSSHEDSWQSADYQTNRLAEII